MNRKIAVHGAAALSMLALTACSTQSGNYHTVSKSTCYGDPQFSRGPERVQLGVSGDRRFQVGDIDLRWRSNQARLPEKTRTITYREWTLEGRESQWLSRTLFGSSDLVLRQPSLVFPEIVQKTRLNLDVAESISAVYPVSIFLEERSKSSATAPIPSSVSVLTSAFYAQSARCHGVVEGKSLNNLGEESRIQKIRETAARGARRHGFSVSGVRENGGYVEFILKGPLQFEARRHTFSVLSQQELQFEKKHE